MGWVRRRTLAERASEDGSSVVRYMYLGISVCVALRFPDNPDCED